MITTLKTTYTIKEICEGFVYNELEAKLKKWLSKKHYSPTKIFYEAVKRLGYNK